MIKYRAKSATISLDGKYRYDLYREWSDSVLPPILWLMLNPSTADADEDDNTINKCATFSQTWGYGAMWVVNKYAYRSTDPGVLKTLPAHEAIGPSNYTAIEVLVPKCHRIVCAWGVPGGPWPDLFLMRKYAGRLYCLGHNKDMSPKHPLYLAKTTKLVPLLAPPVEFKPFVIIDDPLRPKLDVFTPGPWTMVDTDG